MSYPYASQMLATTFQLEWSSSQAQESRLSAQEGTRLTAVLEATSTAMAFPG
jgi:hypothetical protein